MRYPAGGRPRQLRLASTATLPAAYRYTEARLARMSEEMLRDIDKETVDWHPELRRDREKSPGCAAFTGFQTFWSTAQSGIAVGMATNIPPAQPARSDQTRPYRLIRTTPSVPGLDASWSM